MAALSSSLTLLSQELERRQGRRASVRESCSTGVPALDRLLPGGGVKTGGVCEWLSDQAAGGMTLSLLCVAEALRVRETAAAVVIDASGQFFPAGLPAWGMPLNRLIILRPRSRADVLWAWEQVLRCPGVAACAGWLPEASPVALRRLQVAAEQGGGLGLLVRPPEVRKQTSWADVRWRVTPVPLPAVRWGPARGRRFRVELLRCRNQIGGGVADVEFPAHDARPLPVVSPLADPAAAFRPAGSAAASLGAV